MVYLIAMLVLLVPPVLWLLIMALRSHSPQTPESVQLPHTPLDDYITYLNSLENVLPGRIRQLVRAFGTDDNVSAVSTVIRHPEYGDIDVYISVTRVTPASKNEPPIDGGI